MQQPQPANLSLNSIALLNVEGLNTFTSSSVSFIEDILEEYKLLFILLTETWLRDQLDAELHIENYTLYRADRCRKRKRRGRNSGGVAAYVRSDLAVDIMFTYSSDVVDAMCLKLVALNLVVCTVYRQPDDPAGGHRSTADEFDAFVREFSANISSLPTPTPNIILAGDFNLPHAEWPSGTPGQGAPPDERKMLDILANLSSENFLVQVTNHPTHRAGNILDLLLTNCPGTFTSLETTPTAPISSHYLVRYETLFSATGRDRGEKSTNSPFDAVNLFSEETNWERIRAALSEVNWTQEFQNRSPFEMNNILLDTCASLVTINAPKKIKRKLKFSRIPRHRRILMRKRTRLRKNYHRENRVARQKSIQTKLVVVERQLQESYRSQEKHD